MFSIIITVLLSIFYHANAIIILFFGVKKIQQEIFTYENSDKEFKRNSK